MNELFRWERATGLGILLVSTALHTAQAQGWKYMPKQLVKPVKVPAVINPALKPSAQQRLAKLDLAFEINFARTKQQWQTAQTTPTPTACTPQFNNFVNWLDQLPRKRLLSNYNALNALQAVRQTIVNYPTLDPAQQAQVNWLVITLSQLRNAKLGKFNNGDFYKLAYHPAPNETGLPQADRFHLKLERRGILKQTYQAWLAQNPPVTSFAFAQDYEHPDKMIGLTFYQGFQPTYTRQELERVLDTLTPPGYTVRISAHELGISDDRKKFRQGFLHVHFEQINARPGPIPTDIGIELWLGVTPYAGIIDVQTRKIILPFSDKKIAQNYLILFDKYLTPNARQILQYIAR